jgi:hypothetical protein
MSHQTISAANHNAMDPSTKDNISISIKATLDGEGRPSRPTTPGNEFALQIRTVHNSRMPSPTSAPLCAVSLPNPVPQSQLPIWTTSCGSSGPVIKFISQQELEWSTMPPPSQVSDASSSSKFNVKDISKLQPSPKSDLALVSMVYDEVRILWCSKWDSLGKAGVVRQATCQDFSSSVTQVSVLT